jgi:hypothetical protein
MTDKLRDAVFTVLEGFTLPVDVRKILETAYYDKHIDAGYDNCNEQGMLNPGEEPASIPFGTVQAFQNGMTVKALKAVVKDWPERDRFGGDREVWIEVDGLGSNQVTALWPLNAEYTAGVGRNTLMSSADVLLEAKTK